MLTTGLCVYRSCVSPFVAEDPEVLELKGFSSDSGVTPK